MGFFNLKKVCVFFVYLQERIVKPHLKEDFNTVCNIDLGQVEEKLKESEHKPVVSKLSQLFRWIFPLGNDVTRSRKVEL